MRKEGTEQMCRAGGLQVAGGGSTAGDEHGWRCLSRVSLGTHTVWVRGLGREELGVPLQLSGTAVVESHALCQKARQLFSFPTASKYAP